MLFQSRHVCLRVFDSHLFYVLNILLVQGVGGVAATLIKSSPGRVTVSEALQHLLVPFVAHCVFVVTFASLTNLQKQLCTQLCELGHSDNQRQRANMIPEHPTLKLGEVCSSPPHCEAFEGLLGFLVCLEFCSVISFVVTLARAD